MEPKFATKEFEDALFAEWETHEKATDAHQVWDCAECVAFETPIIASINARASTGKRLL